ncbi:radical SAM protein [Gallicola sp. Sow4_E12]|uniref:radical SAM protein n=1 Tax=Gallicola sp. Sow4_E12 TaxID=3438785 RepID=UPI003F8DEF47
MRDIYEMYGKYYYVPMTQGAAISVPVTVGCSWNRCLYCDLNHTNLFRPLSMEEIQRSIVQLKEYYEPIRVKPKKALMMGGNPFCLPTEQLLAICERIRNAFPYIKYISAFARADDILRKSKEELLLLKEAGLDELSIGLESGNDEVLRFHNKGETAAEQKSALKSLEEIEVNYSVYVMLGLGGKEYSKVHAMDTGKLLSDLRPNVIILVTLIAFSDAPLISKIRSKEFIRLTPKESIEEEILMLENIESPGVIFNATHKTNALILKGKLPEHKELLLKKMQDTLKENSGKDLVHRELKKWARWDKE